ncbi:MAG TPA: TIGR03560 family F420-dependent LLM class oxidoreductase [Thermomicrobiales bacterium]|jgi:F420-dependent oxidoreductase-like protein
MKLGLQLVDFAAPGGTRQLACALADTAKMAEAVGIETIGVADHVWQHPFMGGAEREELEAYSVLSFLAAQTDRIGLLALATPATFRAPGLLAKTVTTLDVLSGGRAWLGIGAGHYEDEAAGLGLFFPPVAERFEYLEETIRYCLRMWEGERGDEQPFAGEYVQARRLLNSPQSLTRPHPPLLIAGDGERKTLRLVARYGDACNLAPMPELPHKLDVLRRHCEAEGRDYDAIEKTCSWIFNLGENGEKTGELLEKLDWFAGLGIQTVYGRVEPAFDLATLERLGRDVVPAIAAL